MRTAAAFLLMTTVVAGICGSEDSHQRVGVEADRVHALSVEVSLAMTATDPTQIGHRVSFAGELIVGYAYRKMLFLSVGLPGLLVVPLGPDTGAAAADVGDPSVWLSLLRGDGAVRYRGVVGYAAPLGRWDSHQMRMFRVGAGEGWHTVSAGLGASLIRDPLVVGCSLMYSFGFPRLERFARKLRPAELDLAISFTEVINDRFGVRLHLGSSLSFAAVPVDTVALRNPRLATVMGCTILWDRDKTRGRLGALGPGGNGALATIVGAAGYAWSW